ncbi:tetratricopeptide repeat protein [Mucilaginibacter sp. UR6-11]|uniref:tetratricopeptide repeat protein n=1 Tax=Mucilaginibacter sp. UR6-11 TaxID=1435644 RepID=UPI001E309F0A|nr:tetratricopeptide repeat protein [Mucilaginibacter sp. UR6-11]MCC8426090.1 tetratricopeptide repeat protein [Mucilaginibacter sp. UR6-11]
MKFTRVKKTVLGLLLLFLFSVHPFHLSAAFLIQSNVIIAQHPFDTVNKVTKANRCEAATIHYKRHYRHIPEAIAMKYLDQLSVMARDLNDKALESVVFDLKADYYAVNKLFNNLSIAYYQKAIDFATDNNLALEKAVYLHHEGMFYANFKHNTAACLFFLKSQEAFRDIGFDKVPNIGSYYSQVAEFYYNLGDYANAKIQLQESLKYKIKTPRERIGIENTLALIYRSNHQYQQALNYFNRALNLARQNKDTVWIGIATGNIGSVYLMLNQYEKALPYIQTDYNQSLKYGEKINATIALLRLVKINLLKNNVKQGLKQLDTAQILIHNSPVPVLNLETDILDLRAIFYEKMGLPATALEFRKKYEIAKDSLTKQNNVAAVEVVKMQYVIGKKLAEETRLKTQAKVETVARDTVFIVFFLLLVILVLVYNRQTLKIQKDKEILRSEKLRVDDELKYTGMKLRSYTENLRKNNMLIDSFKEQIEQLKIKNADAAVVGHLEELMQAHIMTDDNWLEFKKIFLKVYPNFFFDIKKQFSSLSESDIRLLTLLKLQSTNKEIANMLGITVEGVKKAKQRLKKKMNLESRITIEETILKI